ncbi:MAG: DUF1501 domain-containing protein [Planctomycetota bacterium]|nr:DUF1501 domain-containing protein [Planctomycetota bacterium]
MKKRLDAVQRRRFMAQVATSLLGVTAFEEFARAADSDKAKATKPAKQIIYLFMTGAMSHLDTFDPKPGAAVQGDTTAINTKISGVKVSQYFPKLANLTNDLAIVRGMSQETGAHGPAQYLIRTSYDEIATTHHPGLGPWIQRLDGRISNTLPASVNIGGKAGSPGYLGAKFAPVPIGDPNKGLENVTMPKYLKDQHFDRRLDLSKTFDKGFRLHAKDNSHVNGYDDLYREAVGLLRSNAITAFDITKEEESIKEKYGKNRFGQGCLLARRLIENGVRFVEVTNGGWDMHRGLNDSITSKGPELDNAVSALLTDLKQKGLLESTLVVVATEFGRTPKINVNAGRDHHPAAFSTILAGGGIKTGQVYGVSDSDGFYVEDQNVSVQDFNATIAAAMGLEHDEEIYSPTGRPFTIANGGSPIGDLLA